MKKIVLMFVICSLAIAAFAQTLQAPASTPVADGIIGDHEYPSFRTDSGMRAGYALSADGKTLYLALEAPTTGWVSLGLGASVMNGAFMVIAYDGKGTQLISEATGHGHGHTVNTDKQLTASAVREKDGKTILEIALPAKKYIDGNGLKLLMAYGAQDDLTSRHTKWASIQVPLK